MADITHTHDTEPAATCLACDMEALALLARSRSGAKGARRECTDARVARIVTALSSQQSEIAVLRRIRDDHERCFILEDGERGQVMARRLLSSK